MSALKLGILGAAMAGILAVGAIGYAATRGSDEPSTAPDTTALVAAPATTGPAPESTPTSDAGIASPVITDAPATTDAPVATEASTTVDTTPAAECVVGTWIMDNAAYAAMATALLADVGATVGVISGQIVVDVQPDGTFQVDSDGFSVDVTLNVGAGHIVWSGGDSGVWSANEDGTFTIEPTVLGTTISTSVSIAGGAFSAPIPSAEGTLQGTHVVECSGDSLNLISNTGEFDYIPLLPA